MGIAYVMMGIIILIINNYVELALKPGFLDKINIILIAKHVLVIKIIVIAAMIPSIVK